MIKHTWLIEMETRTNVGMYAIKYTKEEAYNFKKQMEYLTKGKGLGVSLSQAEEISSFLVQNHVHIRRSNVPYAGENQWEIRDITTHLCSGVYIQIYDLIAEEAV